jgi:hypothetical protein
MLIVVGRSGHFPHIKAGGTGLTQGTPGIHQHYNLVCDIGQYWATSSPLIQAARSIEDFQPDALHFEIKLTQVAYTTAKTIHTLARLIGIGASMHGVRN